MRENLEGKYEKTNRLLENINVVITGICILISVLLGAMVGANFGQQFEGEEFMPFLAESIVREEHNILERMIVSHLHIMVALLASLIMLVILRYAYINGFKGLWYLIAQVLIIPGNIIMAIGAWLVVPDYPAAHKIINVGAGLLLLAALILAIGGWIVTSKKVLGENYESATFGQKLVAVFKDPVSFAMYFQFIWVNFTVTIPGVYVAFNLDLYRSEEYVVVERSFNVGHWHILATINAMIVVLFMVELLMKRDLKRDIVGWLLLFGTIVGFAVATAYMLRAPDASYAIHFFLLHFGLGGMLIGVGLFALFLVVCWLVYKKSIAVKEVTC